MFQTPSEYILGIPKSLQTPKTQNFSNLGDFGLSHTTKNTILGWFSALSVQNWCIECPRDLKKFEKFQNFSNMFQTPSNYILGIPKPLETSKKQICFNFGDFGVSNTPQNAILGSFWAFNFQK